MSTENNTLKTTLVAALVAAGISAAGLGLFLVNQKPAPQQAATPAPAPSATEFTDAQRQSIEKTVREYLIKNPELLVEMSTELERRQAEAEQKLRQTAIAENADAIFREKDPLIGGNPQGDVTIVEFSDYNCPYCKRAFNHIAKIIASDANVRVVMKEFPIFGQQSIGAARVAIAAGKQGKYFAVHTALLRDEGRASEASALRLAEELGLDMDKLKADMNSPDVLKVIADTRQLGEKLGIQGTPFYLVGDKVVPGAPENLYDLFVQHVAEIRKSGCPVC